MIKTSDGCNKNLVYQLKGSLSARFNMCNVIKIYSKSIKKIRCGKVNRKMVEKIKSLKGTSTLTTE